MSRKKDYPGPPTELSTTATTCIGFMVIITACTIWRVLGWLMFHDALWWQQFIGGMIASVIIGFLLYCIVSLAFAVGFEFKRPVEELIDVIKEKRKQPPPEAGGLNTPEDK